MIVVQDDIWLCDDCTSYAVNGDLTGIDYYLSGDEAGDRARAVQEGVDAFGPHLVVDEGREEFSRCSCDGCGTVLAGSRSRFALLGSSEGGDDPPGAGLGSPGSGEDGSDATWRDEIVEGMVEILWGSAWAEHVDEHRCCSLSGCEITDVMPSAPEQARTHAERIAAHYENDNETTIDALYRRALRADGSSEDDGTASSARRFGNCLAHMADGTGVSWFDDHEEFPLAVPHDAGVATGELRCLADEGCEEGGKDPPPWGV